MRQQPGRGIKCGQAIAAASIASRLLPRLPSQFQSRPGCWPASKRGNSTYPFAKALVAANDSGNILGKKKRILIRKPRHTGHHFTVSSIVKYPTLIVDAACIQHCSTWVMLWALHVDLPPCWSLLVAHSFYRTGDTATMRLITGGTPPTK